MASPRWSSRRWAVPVELEIAKRLNEFDVGEDIPIENMMSLSGSCDSSGW